MASEQQLALIEQKFPVALASLGCLENLWLYCSETETWCPITNIAPSGSFYPSAGHILAIDIVCDSFLTEEY